jgi:hypothetical protein
MLKPLAQYVKDEGIPRWRNILLTPETFIAVTVVAIFLLYGGELFATSPKIGDLTTGLIAYASIALGFCVAGLTISLTLPDRDFASHLATLKRPGQSTNSYSDLLFVFSWTAIAHWGTILVLFVVILLTESNSALLPIGHTKGRTVIVSLIAGICTYCLCQFLITLITLSQVGAVYIRHLAQRHPDTGDQSEPTDDQ